MGDGQRFRIDDLRRFAAGLAASVGLAPTRAAAFATHLLWHDAAGASQLGLATLPAWLERLARGEFDLATEGRVVSEQAGSLVLDAQAGLPPLLLARAAAIAQQKARDVGVSLVRLTHMAPLDSAAEVAAGVALGPQIAFAIGPHRAWTIAVPSAEGLPLVFDSGFGPLQTKPLPGTGFEAALAPWSLLAPDGGWLVGVMLVNVLESLAAFHERVTAALKADGACRWVLKPHAWEAYRNEVRQLGVLVSETTRHELEQWAVKFGFELPEACSGSSA